MHAADDPPAAKPQGNRRPADPVPSNEGVGALADIVVDEEGSDAGKILTVTPVGEIDLSNADQLQQAVITAWQASGQPVVVDLGRVGFMGSAGLGALVVAARSVRAEGGDLRLHRVSRRLRRLLGIMGLEGVLALED